MKLAKNTLLTFLLVATLEAISLVITTTARAVPLPVNAGIAQQEVLPSALELAPTEPITPVDLPETPASQVSPTTQLENPVAPTEPIQPETPASQVSPTTQLENSPTTPTEAVRNQKLLMRLLPWK